MRIAAAVSMLLAMSSAALAEPAYMEVQRCIWRCLADSKGASDPAYQACVSRVCDEEPVRQSKKGERWTYGRHPVLGQSAHVKVGEEAFGFACVTDPNVGWGGSLRITPGLAETITQDMKATGLYVGPFRLGGQYVFTPHPAGFSEQLGDGCNFNFDGIQNSKAMIFLRDKFVSIQAEGNKPA
jgi:hypothetical protein